MLSTEPIYPLYLLETGLDPVEAWISYVAFQHISVNLNYRSLARNKYNCIHVTLYNIGFK